MVFSPFDFEKLCLKGGLDGLVSLSPSHGQFLAVCQVARKIFGCAEGSPYNQRTYFPVFSEKFFRSKERGLRFCSKMPFLLSNGQNDAEYHGSVITRAKKKGLSH